MCSFFDAKPGGRQDVELKQLYDAVIAPPRQKSSGTADTINLKFTATTKASGKAPYSAGR